MNHWLTKSFLAIVLLPAPAALAPSAALGQSSPAAAHTDSTAFPQSIPEYDAPPKSDAAAPALQPPVNDSSQVQRTPSAIPSADASSMASTGSPSRASVSVAQNPVVSTPAPGGTAPSNPTIDPLEQETIHRPGSADPAAPQDRAPAPAPDSFDFARVALALGAVIGLILLLRWCGRKLMPGAIPARGNRGVHVLSRTVIGPKQQLLIIQIGRRLVAVGDNGGQLTSLCQITDPDEVALLIGQSRRGSHAEDGNRAEDSASDSPFEPLLDKAAATYERPETADFSTRNTDRAPERQPRDLAQLSSDTVELSSQTAHRSTGPAERSSETAPPDALAEPPEIAETRNELSGLTERVKRLARQFGQA
jgi:flagellar biogenesis protein FliO